MNYAIPFPLPPRQRQRAFRVSHHEAAGRWQATRPSSVADQDAVRFFSGRSLQGGPRIQL